MTQSVSVETADGWTIDMLRMAAAPPVRGAALLGHAMMVDRRSMDRPAGDGLASTLAAAGWEVFLPDLRGRGASGPSVSEGGRWSYDEIIRFDLPACLEAIRDHCPGAAVVVVGHSLVGHASAAAAGAGFYPRPPDAHVLLSANVWMPSLEPSWWRRRRKGSAMLAFDLFRRLWGYFPARRVGMGPVDEAGPYVADLVRLWRSDRWGSADGAIDYLEGLRRVTGPVLSLVGRGDRLLAHPVGARNWADHFGVGRVHFQVLGRGDLGLDFDPDHMTLVTDPRSRAAWQMIASWMTEQTLSLDRSGSAVY